ncbi:transposase, partial [Methylobacterium sp. D54C]
MPNETQRIEIITGRERRRRYTGQEKVRFVEETMQPGMTVSAVARMHGISPSLLFGWRRRMAEGGQIAVQADEEVVAASRVRELEARVRDLERLLACKTLEVEVLKEALAVARVKKRMARPVRKVVGEGACVRSAQTYPACRRSGRRQDGEPHVPG